MAKKNNQQAIIFGVGFALGFIMLLLIFQKKKAYELLEKSKKKNDDLLTDNQILLDANKELVNIVNEYEENLVSFKKFIENNNQLEEEVKKNLTKLVDKYKGIDNKVSNELKAAMSLIDAQQPTKAAFSLAKIVENLLCEKYALDGEFKEFVKTNNNGKKKTPVFNDYLEYAKNQNHIGPEEYHFAKGLKEIRNQEGHDLDVKKNESWMATAIFTGIGLIMKLGETLNRTIVN